MDPERNRERATELRYRFIGEKDPASLIESSRLNLSRADDAFYQDYTWSSSEARPILAA